MSDNAKWHWGEGNKYVLEGVKTILLVNGAAAVSMLTFIGNFKLHPTKTLIVAMLLFSGGAMSSVLIFGSAYLTQLHYGNENSDMATKWHKYTYAVVLFSIILFLSGIGFTAYGFFHLPDNNPCDST